MILSRISLNDISFTESLNLRDLLTRHEIWVSILVAFHSTFGFIFGNSLIIGFLLNMNQLHSWIHNWVKGNFGNAHDGPTPSWFWSPISPNSHECWIFLTLNTKEKESYCLSCIKDIQVTLDQTGFLDGLRRTAYGYVQNRMEQFRFRNQNWNRNRNQPLFKLDGISVEWYPIFAKNANISAFPIYRISDMPSI